MSAEMEAAARRTKRRYAHELYPHAEEFEVRPLEVEVPYLYARAIGLDVWGTGWFDMREGEQIRTAGDRTLLQGEVRRAALMADAMAQGLTGDQAWAWAAARHWNYEGEFIWERADHYGVPVDNIKPYECGPEPDKHDHYSPPDAHGWRIGTSIAGKESECPDCTEEVS